MKTILTTINKLKEEYLLALTFITINLINSIVLCIITISNGLRFSSVVMELGFLLLVALISLLIKKKKRINYYIIVTIIFTITCIINSIYYHYYSSFASFSILANISFASEVSDAIVDNVLKPIDIIYIWAPIALLLVYKYMKKKGKQPKDSLIKSKITVKKTLLAVFILFLLGFITMPINAWGRLYKLWNRESVVMNFGIYIYQFYDSVQSISPKINSMFGHDKALKATVEYYKQNKYQKETNEYTNIFKGKNVIVIHAESIQKFTMDLEFNGKEVTPNLNKLAEEGMFFNNFYSQVGVGTSSDSEFTFNTSLMPSTKGTAFVNYFDRDYIAIPNLLKTSGYYTFSMHANTGTFWNRNIMYQALGYDDFYSKESYIIDETIGLGLSDKSFFRQSVEKIKQIKEDKKEPYYGLLIMLSNHTPFNDLELTDEFDTSITTNINGKKVTRDYLEGTVMKNYLRSVHYADSAIGELIDRLDKEDLLEDTVIIIYGDHDARISYKEFNLLYNYDPVEDRIKTEKDDGFIPYSAYNNKINEKVPLIVWTKSKKYNIVVDIPMAMIDVLPTIGNMLDIHSEYQLGTDIFSLKDKDNTVVFVDGSYLTSKIYYNSSKPEIYPITNEPVSEEYIKDRVEYSNKLIEVSNNIISYNLIKELKGVSK